MFPEVFCQVWSLLFLIMPSRCVTAGCSNTTKDDVSQSTPISVQTTDVFGWLKWRNTRSYVVHTSSRHALNGAFTASSVWLIRPCCYQMQFQRYSGEVRRLGRLQRRRKGLFFKARKTQGKWPFSNTPMHNPVHFRAKRHVHTMLTFSVFMAWKHAVIFRINKNIVSDFISWQDKHKNIKPFSLCLSLF